MRILHLSHGYPPAVGGSETVMAELSTRLARRHAVTVVTTTAYNTQAFRERGVRTMRPGEELRDGVRVRRHDADPRLSLRLRRAQRVAYRLRLPGNGLVRTLYDGPVAAGMLRDAVSQAADVIGATAFPLLHMQYAAWAGRARRVPVVLWGALHPEDRWGFDRGPIRLAVRHADAYLAYTEFERLHAERYGMRPEAVHVIPPGVDVERFGQADGTALRTELGIPTGEPVIGFLGQLGGHKGVVELVHAMKRVWAAEPDAWLVVAGGSSPYVPQIQAAMAELDAPHAARTRLLLDVEEHRKPEILAAFDVFASPSGFESFGLTFVEAWAAGLPVVGCRAGAIPAVVTHGEDGLLVGYQQVGELAGALVELLGDRAYAEGLARRGRRKAHDVYRWERSAGLLETLYESLA